MFCPFFGVTIQNIRPEFKEKTSRPKHNADLVGKIRVIASGYGIKSGRVECFRWRHSAATEQTLREMVISARQGFFESRNVGQHINTLVTCVQGDDRFY